MASSSYCVPSSPSVFPSSSLPSFSSLNHTITIKLNTKNYLLWKTQLLIVAIANGIEKLFESSYLPPPPFLDNLSSQSNPDYNVWQRYNALLLSWIFSSISEDILPQIVSLTSASEVWATLAHTFASTSLARITELRTQLHSISKDGKSASAYIQNITILCNTLAEIGEPMSHHDRLIYFLGGLGIEYDAFVTSVSNRSDPPSLEELHSLLQTFDFHLERRNSSLSLLLPNKNLSLDQALNLNIEVFQMELQRYYDYNLCFAN